VNLPGQTVYSKALILFVALSLLLGTAVVTLTSYIILGEFKESERQEMVATLQRLDIMLARQLPPIEISLDQWRERAEIDVSHLPAQGWPSHPTGLQFDFIGTTDHDGHIASIVCPDTGTRAVIGTAADLAASLSALDENGDAPPKDRHSGFVLLGDQLASVAWQPLAAGGRLFAGRLFKSGALGFLEGLFGGHIQFVPLRNVHIDGNGDQPLLAMLAKHEFSIDATAPDEIVGSTLVRGIDGRPIGQINLIQGRPLMREGTRAVQIFLTILTLAGGVLIFLVWFLLDRTILDRISDLTRKVQEEKGSGRLPVRLAFGGSDELAHLARSIEELAGLLELAQHQYRAVVEDQTEIICRFDPQFTITFANGVFEKLFGTGATPPPHLGELVPKASFEAIALEFGTLTPEKPLEPFLQEIPFEGGHKIWFRSTLRRNFSPDGRCLGGQWVAADITPQIEAQRKLQESERQLRSLSGRLLRLQDEERRKIARELHDSTAQNLSALEMNVSLIQDLLPGAGEKIGRLLRETREIATNCSREIRTISYLLHPPLLDEVGLCFAIRWFVDGYVGRTGIAVQTDLPDDLPRMASEIETTLFRVVQESLTNIYRHAESPTATLRLNRSEKGILSLEITDRGKGFSPSTIGAGYPAGVVPGVGLVGMRERLRQFGGNLNVRSGPHGTTITATLDLTHE